MKKYDFIIAGGGMAGLSLAYYLNHSTLRDKSILILDREIKNQNDRTWCFWEKGRNNPFEKIMCRCWDTVAFQGPGITQNLDMGGYYYKMMRGIDFYDFVRSDLQQNPNITFKQATVERIKDTPEGGFVITTDEPYLGNFVFDSTTPLKLNLPQNHNLLQHFKGWVIETPEPRFDPDVPMMMDFGIDQGGDCRFMYVLPFNNSKALVEYTLFNESLLEQDVYEVALKKYVETDLKITNYSLAETEYGVIPMSDENIERFVGKHIVRIGLSGGATKASTGYTFLRSQHDLQQMVENIAKNGSAVPQTNWFKGRFKWYDSILLNVLEQKRFPAAGVFAQLYKHNPPAQVFKFLDEDTNLLEEIRIFLTLPIGVFLSAAFAVFLRKI